MAAFTWTSLRSLAIAALIALAGLPLGQPAQGAASSTSDLDAVLDQSHQNANNEDFLPPEKAFRLSATALGNDQVQLDWVIAPGYYLYRDRIKITDDTGQIGAPQFPEGQVKQDEYFGKQVVYHQELKATVPLLKPAQRQRVAAAARDLPGLRRGGAVLSAHYAGAQYCVPGQRRRGGGGAPAPPHPAVPRAMCPSRTGSPHCCEPARCSPCCSNSLSAACCWPLPLACCRWCRSFPASSSARASPSRPAARFLLSLTYVLGMSLTYTITGVAFAAAGKQVQAVFQQPWIIVLFAALFVAMALSMFGLFTLQMPSFIQTRVADVSNRQRGGNFGGVAVMGALSALIVTTCVGPVLVAALIVIGQTGDMVRGGAALFVDEPGDGRATCSRSAVPPGAGCRAPASGWTASSGFSACSCSRWPPG